MILVAIWSEDDAAVGGVRLHNTTENGLLFAPENPAFKVTKYVPAVVTVMEPKSVVEKLTNPATLKVAVEVPLALCVVNTLPLLYSEAKLRLQLFSVPLLALVFDTSKTFNVQVPLGSMDEPNAAKVATVPNVLQ